ncbi:hypothetical protein Fmac_030264 [Flemingia macrophylla]|uniref:Uncharacterized protein n=1 Tax=Flemingia macrophylla TaxID=520843 RepID=A0ABD1LCQ4_9FABA
MVYDMSQSSQDPPSWNFFLIFVDNSMAADLPTTIWQGIGGFPTASRMLFRIVCVDAAQHNLRKYNEMDLLSC